MRSLAITILACCVAGCTEPNNKQLATVDIQNRIARSQRNMVRETNQHLAGQGGSVAKAHWEVDGDRATFDYQQLMVGHANLVSATYDNTNGLTLTFNAPPQLRTDYENRPVDVFLVSRGGHLYEASECFSSSFSGSVIRNGNQILLPVSLTGDDACRTVEIIPRHEAFDHIVLPSVGGRATIGGAR